MDGTDILIGFPSLLVMVPYLCDKKNVKQDSSRLDLVF